MDYWRSRLISPLQKYMPPIYRVIKKVQKNAPIGQDEQKVVAYYENSVLIHIASLMMCIPGIWTYLRHVRGNKDLFKDLRPAYLKILIWSGLAFNLFILSGLYDNYQNPKQQVVQLSDKYRHELKQEMVSKFINRNQ